MPIQGKSDFRRKGYSYKPDEEVDWDKAEGYFRSN